MWLHLAHTYLLQMQQGIFLVLTPAQMEHLCLSIIQQMVLHVVASLIYLICNIYLLDTLDNIKVISHLQWLTLANSSVPIVSLLMTLMSVMEHLIVMTGVMKLPTVVHVRLKTNISYYCIFL